VKHYATLINTQDGPAHLVLLISDKDKLFISDVFKSDFVVSRSFDVKCWC